MNYSIHILKVGQADVCGPEIYWMSKWEDWETLNFYVLVVRGGEKTVVINTGPPEDLTELNRAWTGYIGHERGAMKVTANELPATVLPSVGVDPMSIGGWVSDRMAARYGRKVGLLLVGAGGLGLGAVLLYVGANTSETVTAVTLMSLALGCSGVSDVTPKVLLAEWCHGNPRAGQWSVGVPKQISGVGRCAKRLPSVLRAHRED